MADETSGQGVSITGADIASLAGKLEELERTLPPNERLVLDWLLQRAASAEGGEEVQAFTLPFAGPAGDLTQSFNLALGFSFAPPATKAIVIETSQP